MQMIEVQSSNVAAIGYDPDVHTLAVRYRDGHLYVMSGIQSVQYADLMAAPSKGRWLAANFRGKEVVDREQPGTQRGGGCSSTSTAEPAPLQTHDQDPCCAPRMEKAMRAGQLDTADSWVCPNCGEEWCMKTVGPVRHWRMKPSVVIFR